MARHPLAEVFGFPVDNTSADAARCRDNRLCPFNNKVPNCTKDKPDNPLGVCSVFEGDGAAITCPVRLREGWLVVEDAARFFFPPDANWTTAREAPLKDRHGEAAGKIDVVVVSYDSTGRVTDFGGLEVQAVYISGNVRRPFEYYMDAPTERANMDWTGEANYPRPDYLSSTRKRLAPQLLYKGGILNAWGRKIAVALDRNLYRTLPSLRTVQQGDADAAWLVYELQRVANGERYALSRVQTVYTKFQQALRKITKPAVGSEEAFIEVLHEKLNEAVESENPPEAPVMDVELFP
jgi:hypothetical protein